VDEFKVFWKFHIDELPALKQRLICQDRADAAKVKQEVANIRNVLRHHEATRRQAEEAAEAALKASAAALLTFAATLARFKSAQKEASESGDTPRSISEKGAQKRALAELAMQRATPIDMDEFKKNLVEFELCYKDDAAGKGSRIEQAWAEAQGAPTEFDTFMRRLNILQGMYHGARKTLRPGADVLAAGKEAVAIFRRAKEAKIPKLVETESLVKTQMQCSREVVEARAMEKDALAALEQAEVGSKAKSTERIKAMDTTMKAELQRLLRWQCMLTNWQKKVRGMQAKMKAIVGMIIIGKGEQAPPGFMTLEGNLSYGNECNAVNQLCVSTRSTMTQAFGVTPDTPPISGLCLTRSHAPAGFQRIDRATNTGTGARAFYLCFTRDRSGSLATPVGGSILAPVTEIKVVIKELGGFAISQPDGFHMFRQDLNNSDKTSEVKVATFRPTVHLCFKQMSWGPWNL